MQCPNCGDESYRTYANGNVKTGYCQRCSHETSVPSKEKDKLPIIHIEKPKRQGSNDRIRRK